MPEEPQTNVKARPLTAAQHERALQEARRKHDAKYEVDHPRPLPDHFAGDLTLLEKLVQRLWVVWTVLALAGAFISLPHTLRTVLATVDLKPALALAYSLAVFLGVELALIAVALASELKKSETEAPTPPRQHSLAGVLNSLAMGVGFKPLIDTSHLPERRPSSGGLLVILLFAASLSFNLADTLKDVTLLAPFEAEIHLAARLMAGALGPGLLLIAGHRFAYEVVRAASGRRTREYAYQQALQTWQAGLQASWEQNGEQWQQAALAAAWRARNSHVPDELNPYLAEAGPPPFSMTLSSNGHQAAVI